MVKKATSKGLVTWDEELAKQAQLLASAEANSSAGSGQFFTLRGGILSWQDSPMPGNQMAVIVLDSVFENVYYAGEYDPDVPQSPTCFAFGRDEKLLAPHSTVVAAGQHPFTTCTGCPKNEFGTAEKGKGKACRNTRRLALLAAGSINQQNGKFELITDPEHYTTSSIGYLKLPVTSVKGFSSFVQQVAGVLKRPPFGVVTLIKVVPDAKSQFRVTFEPLVNVPNELVGVLLKRREEIATSIEFPYQLESADEAAPRGKQAKQPKGRQTRKY